MHHPTRRRMLCRSAVVILILFLPFVTSEKAYILNTLNATVELDWRTVTNVDGEDGWLEETYRSEEDGLNHQAFSVCNVEHKDPDNWLLVPRLARGEANRVFIEVKFSMRSCAEMPAYSRACKETLRLYARPASLTDELDGERWQDDPHWLLVDTIAATSSEKARSYTQTTSFATNASHVFFAFRDSGACSSLLSVKVFYQICPSQTVDFTFLPRTVSGSDLHSVVSVPGKCVANAAPQPGMLVPATSICRADGRWEQLATSSSAAGCECNAGYVAVANESMCSACAIGTFKSSRGLGVCLLCPINSASSTAGSRECKCDAGFFRAPNESSETACTQPPSKPSALRVARLNQTSVTLTWEEPSSLGGRREVWYSFKCPKCSKNAVARPSRASFKEKQLVLSNLEPGVPYTLMIFAHNEVSVLSDLKQYEVIEFTTQRSADLDVGPLRIDAELESGLTLAWQSVPHVHQYEVEARYENVSSFTHSRVPYFSFPSLSKRFAYSFRVRAWTHDDGVTDWSDPLFYRVGAGVITGPEATRAGLIVPRSFNLAPRAELDTFEGPADALLPANFWPWIIVSFLGVAFIIVVLMFVSSRARRNRKQMSDLDVLDTYKQDTMTPDTAHRPKSQSPVFSASTLPKTFMRKLNVPLIPVYGTQKSMHKSNHCYVDPSTYENPKEALDDFANDIDPKLIQVFRQIGVGEFGEVCCGRLLVDGAYGAVAQVVAVKTLLPGSSEKAKADFLTEASIMGQFEHENVIHLIGVVTRSEPVMIVTEYMLNGALDKFLRDNDNGTLTVVQLAAMMKGIAAGMKYLTDMGYIHRDLAARNILVDDCLTCKIADFGLSRGSRGVQEPEYTTNGGKIPIRWTAPEAITHHKYTPASDVWSFGIVMWEVCSFGERPYWDWTNHKVINEIHAGYRLPCPMDSPLELHALMLACWHADRHKRPTFGQLVQALGVFINRTQGIYDKDVDNSSGAGGAVYQSTTNLTGDLARGYSPPSFSVPSPPSSMPPTSLPAGLGLEDFLLANGLAHCLGPLHVCGVTSLVDLTRLSHSDLAALGLQPVDALQLADAIRNFSNTQGMASTLLHLRQQPGLLRNQRSPMLSGVSNGTTQTFLTAASSTSTSPAGRYHTAHEGFPV